MPWCLKGNVQTISPVCHWYDAEAVHDGSAKCEYQQVIHGNMIAI
jgi:hypothetical protein